MQEITRTLPGLRAWAAPAPLSSDRSLHRYVSSVEQDLLIGTAWGRPTVAPLKVGVTSPERCSHRPVTVVAFEASERHERFRRGDRRARARGTGDARHGVRRPGPASIDLTDIADKAQLRRAVQSAVDDVVNNAITFSPTVVRVENARVVGDRMYILLLIADADGEKTLEAIEADGTTARDSNSAAESSD